MLWLCRDCNPTQSYKVNIITLKLINYVFEEYKTMIAHY